MGGIRALNEQLVNKIINRISVNNQDPKAITINIQN